jgi:hypothetical protein
MEKIPFTSYDFWGYLASGFLLLYVADYVYATSLLNRDEWTIVEGVVAMSSAYVVGQLVSSVSITLLERILVGKVLGYPSEVLFGRIQPAGFVRFCTGIYYKQLPPQTQKAALEKGRLVGVDEPGEALFWPAFEHARATPAVMSRLGDFLNQYGFARNIAVVCAINAALLFWSYGKGGRALDLYLAWAAVFCSLGMTLRYLKFFRLYGVELFTSFAYAKEKDKAKEDK